MILIFDYDGTCHDTLRAYGQAVRSAVQWLSGQGYFPARPTDDRTLSRYLGMTTADMWADFLPGAPADITKQAAELVGSGLAAAAERKTARLYAGIEPLCEMLRDMGHTLLILSNCTRRYRDAHWESFGLGRYFAKFYASEDYGGIPKEEIFPHIRAEYPGRYCIIGDRLSDMRVGYVHGFPTVACHYGYGTAEELRDADYHVHSVTELTRLLQAGILPVQESD